MKKYDRQHLEQNLYYWIYDDNKPVENRENKIGCAINKYVIDNNLNKFYRYRSITDYTMQNIKEKSIWLSTANTFNDIYDSTFSFIGQNEWEDIKKNMEYFLEMLGRIRGIKGKTVRTVIKCVFQLLSKEQTKIFYEYYDLIYKLYIKDIQSKSLIGCFSENYDSAYMWGIYGDNGRGICLEYEYDDIKKITQAEKLGFCPVLYRNSYPNAQNLFREYMKSGKTFESNYLSIVKSEEWKQEKEWRIIGETEDLKGKNIGKITPSCVYFGPNISTENRKKMEKILQENNISCKELKRSLTDFSIRPIL